MISFERNGKDVMAKISYCVKYGSEWWFKLVSTRESEHEAQMLFAILHDQLSEKLRKIRQEQYLAGYKDAKAKKGKETWFSGSF